MELSRQLRNLRRRWPLLLLTTVLGLGLGFVTAPADGAVQEEDIYWQATHTLVASEGAGTVNLAQAAFFTSVGEVPQRVAAEFDGRPVPAEIRTQTIELVGTLQIVAIGRDAEQTARVADLYGKHLLQYLTEQTQEQQERERDRVLARLDSLQNRIDQLDAALAVNPEQDVTQAERDALVNQYRLTYERFQQLAAQDGSSIGLSTLDSGDPIPITEGQRRSALSTPTVQTDARNSSREEEAPRVPEARNASSPLGRGPRTAVGAIAGLLAGVAIAVVLDRLDTRIRSKEEAEAAFGYPVIAEVPPLTRRQRRRHQLFSFDHPGSRVAESYRALRTSLTFAAKAVEDAHAAPNGDGSPNGRGATPPRVPSVVMVTSPGPSEGKTTSTANLAAAFAEAGSRVLVIGCDFRRPRIQDHLTVADAPLLVEAADDSELTGLARPTQVPGVDLVESAQGGAVVPNPAALVAAQRTLVEQARDQYDVVLLDTAPLLTTNDASDLLPVADIVVVVCRSGKTNSNAAGRSAELLERLGAPVAGVSIVGIKEAPAGRRYYYAAPPSRPGTDGGQAPSAPAVDADDSGAPSPADQLN